MGVEPNPSSLELKQAFKMGVKPRPLCVCTVGGKSLVTFSFYKTVHRFCFYARKYKYGTEQNKTEINEKP